MKKRSAQVFCFIFLSLCIFSCHKHKKEEAIKKVTVNIHAINLLSDTVRIVKFNLLNFQEIPLAEVKLDSIGTGTMEFDLETPILAALMVKLQQSPMDMNNELYLSPGDTLQITLDGADLNHTIQYQGNGANVNNYLAQSYIVKQPFLINEGKFIWDLEVNEFLGRLDSMKNALSVFREHFADSTAMPDTMRAILEKKNYIDVLSQKYMYAYLLTNNFAVDALFNNKKVASFVLPESLMSIDAEVPYDTAFLHLGMPKYALLLKNYITRSVIFPFYIGKTRTDLEAVNTEMPIIIDSLLRTHQFPAEFQDYFLANNVDTYMTLQGITPSVDTVYQIFKAKNAHSEYLPSLEERYNRWLAIKPGALAPDFYGITPEDKKLSLSDLRGKIVYVDVWATWCGPCLEELPESKKLQKQFADNNEVAFLYISRDMDENAWKKFLKADKEFKGVHILDTAPEDESILRKYMLAGIPRYILIDQAGKIVNANADRPSSGKIGGQIRALLNDKSKAKR